MILENNFIVDDEIESESGDSDDGSDDELDYEEIEIEPDSDIDINDDSGTENMEISEDVNEIKQVDSDFNIADNVELVPDTEAESNDKGVDSDINISNKSDTVLDMEVASVKEEVDSEIDIDDKALPDGDKTSKKATKAASADAEKPRKKIGPQKQKPAIHILLKKAKIYEIRKISRRVTKLRSLKGTDEEKAKNLRKVEKLLSEMEAMKGFIIEKITERTVDIFKTKSEELFQNMWTVCCKDSKEVELLLQKFSMEKSEDMFENIAYLKLLSSKDTLKKLKQIANGVNINPVKNKRKSQKSNLKNQKNAKNKFDRGKNVSNKSKSKDQDLAEDKSNISVKKVVKTPKIHVLKENKLGKAEEKVNNSVTDENEVKENQKSLKSKKKESRKPKETVKVNEPVIQSKNTPDDLPAKPKKKKVQKSSSGDSFFLNQQGVENDCSDNEDTVSDDEEFSAPVSLANVNLESNKPKNRMGQRRRKEMYEKEMQPHKGKFERGSSNRRRDNESSSYNKRDNGGSNYKRRDNGASSYNRRDNGSTSYNKRDNGGSNYNRKDNPGSKYGNSKTFKNKQAGQSKKGVDKSLHPSWVAKQTMKAKQGITSFSGTKITFDD